MTAKPSTRVASTSSSPRDLAKACFERTPIALAVVDSSFHIVRLNEAGERLFSVGEDLAGRLASGQSPDGDIDWRSEMHRAVETGARRRFECVSYGGAADGVRTLTVTLLPLDVEAGGQTAGLLVAAEDATVEADLRKRLAASENMAAVGRLAARVAHELNNPLDGTMRYVNLCARLLNDPDEAALGYLEQARLGLTRMARIVSELLEFSRSTPMLTESGNINWVVQEAMRAMSEHADKSEVIVAADFHDDKRMPTVEGTRLFQVCCNLFKNAIDAMPHGGCLTITTGIVDEQVLIRFEDTGVGLPDDIERIFEPFYTTKSAGQGTGLGLAICKDYVEQLHGRITAERGEENGAVFTIRIPVAGCLLPTCQR